MTIGRIPSVEGGIQPTIVDAKGDLIAGVAADSINRLAVGSNDQVLVADSSTSTGLAWKSVATPFAAGKNKILNSDYSIWQRGTSSLTFTNGVSYTADRWAGVVSGGAPTCTVTRQTADTTGLTYGARFGRNSGQTATGTPYFCQALESIASKPLAGQTVTISFYAKKGADAPSTLYAGFYFGTGTDQSINTLFNGGGWTNTTQSNTGFTVTTTMTRYSVTINVASTINQALLYFAYTSSGTAGANEWYQIEGVQVEIGSVATAFQTATGTLQGELAACQRYYYRHTAGAVFSTFGQGNARSTTNTAANIIFPVPMRTAPTSLDAGTASNYRVYDGQNATTCTTLAIEGQSDAYTGIVYTTVASGLTATRSYTLDANNTTAAYIGFSAEL